MLYARLLLATLILATTSLSFADEVQLKNGDRYTGNVIRLEGGKLTFKTAHGQLGIPWADVTALSVEKQMLVKTTADAEPRLMQLNGTELAAISSLSLPEPPIIVTGGANAGFLSTGGNTDINTTRLDGEVVARAAANRYTFTGTVNRAKDVDRETARNASVSARYDRFLTPRLFANANGIFTNDRFRDLDLRSAVGAGLGYQLLDTALTKLSVEGGPGYVNENFESAPDDSYAALREAAKLDLFVVGDRVVVFHLHDGYFGVTGEDNLFVKMQNGVRFGLVGGLVTTAQLDMDYDRSPAPGRRKTDRTFALTFGYRF
jgi:putative salt-induced outer membrane protein YdiY